MVGQGTATIPASVMVSTPFTFFASIARSRRGHLEEMSMGQGLVLEIQRDALDKDVPVTTLLRKVRLAAAKLQLTTVEEWVGHELNGYSGELPPYRRARGTPTLLNPFHGWQPSCGNVRIFTISSLI